MSEVENNDGSEFEGGGAQIRREDSAAIDARERRQLPLVRDCAVIVPSMARSKFRDLRRDAVNALSRLKIPLSLLQRG